MPNKLEAVLPSNKVRAHTRGLQKKLVSLRDQHAPLSDFRLLQFTVVQEYLKGQRYFVSLQGRLLSELRADGHPLLGQRREALKLFTALSELYDLMRNVNAHIAELESQEREASEADDRAAGAVWPVTDGHGSRTTGPGSR